MLRERVAGQGRWGRLRPVFGARDVTALVLMGLGVVLWAVRLMAGEGPSDALGASGFGVFALAVGALLAMHASTPTFVWAGYVLFVTTRGRCLGVYKRWVWAGGLWLLPLVFLAQLDLAVRGGLGAGFLVVAWHVVGVTLLVVGPVRTLRSGVGVQAGD